MSLTAGPSRTVAVVKHSSTGKPARYSTFSSGNNGLTWEHRTDLDPAHARPGTGAPPAGRQFAARPVDHTALEQEGLTVSAIGIAGEKLMIAGKTGPADRRESFGISIEVPAP
ncbi:hypothetical protein GU243_05320 [Pseudarthrobacter psychrotolerans]|uniref:Uncharacterized protein n=1 Tax=Pseudarthrobacter psychrotolerans TaxID=2697569 RepID=A0A6P1NKE2_9MICC|nr:hypothetical protein [Pseudarthrobacter psychrotolerans]QHK19267.1 hypothetical protein GU243_05320 [Pseudarthrobacter psychrotolerans]